MNRLHFLLLLINLTCQVSFSQPVIGYEQVTTGLNNPVDVVTDGSSRLFIVQQGGLIRLWNGTSLGTFLDVSSLITSPAGNEQGLLSLAFHPDYSTNRYFFIWYTGTGGLLTLARYRRDAVNPDLADPSTAQILFTQAKPGTPSFTNHNGAKLNFGTDGYLYIGTGDGGSGGDPFNNAQNGASYLGKMLRIDVNSFATSAPFYDIPPSNPYLAPADGILDEIYAFGLRNPWRWSFDRVTGDMWIADVGQNAWEEVNFRPAGSTSGVNYGWRCYEGAVAYSGGGCTPPGTVAPVFTYPHNNTTGGFSITGGYVYRGAEFPALQGYYVMADYVSGNLWTIRPDGSGGWQTNIQSGLPSNISSFGESADGTLYAVKRNTGILYKVVVTAVIPVTITRFDGQSFQTYNLLHWDCEQANEVSRFDIEYSRDGRNFHSIGSVRATPTRMYEYKHEQPEPGMAYYRLAIHENNLMTRYSHTVRLAGQPVTSYQVSPNPIIHQSFRINLEGSETSLQLAEMNGRPVWLQTCQGEKGMTHFTLPALPTGIYILTINNKYRTERLTLFIDQ